MADAQKNYLLSIKEVNQLGYFLKIDFLKIDLLMWQDGDPVQLDDRVEIVDDGIELKIMNARESDTGRYTCVARNPAGQQSLAYDLEVHGEGSLRTQLETEPCLFVIFAKSISASSICYHFADYKNH